MAKITSSNQTDESLVKNATFFGENLQTYGKHIQHLDTYAAIRSAVNQSLEDIDCLLDIGNGGVFDYDVNVVPHIVALDLFLDQIDTSAFPSHVEFKTGSALEIPEANESFDGVLMVMVIHHLVGKTIVESLANARVAIREAFRVLRPGGRVIIIESCVPNWFYTFERAIFPLASRLIGFMLAHPVTVQYPVNLIRDIALEHSNDVQVLNIPKGRWVLQYGHRFPSALTPINPYRLVLNKPGAGTASQ